MRHMRALGRPAASASVALALRRCGRAPLSLSQQLQSSQAPRCHLSTFSGWPTTSQPQTARRRLSRLAVAGQRTDARPAEQQLPARVATFRGLSGDDFRHPLDANNTRILRLLPGLEVVARAFMGSVAEKVLYLENVSSAIQVGPQQLPSLHAMLQEAAGILGLEAPTLYVKQNPSPNAYTLAVSGKRPFIVVHSSLIELLTPEELQTVLAHELGHLKCEHGTILTAANLAALGAVSLLPFISSSVESGLLRWLRAAELTCDRAALLVAQDPRVVVSALMKLAGGSRSLAAELNVDAFLQQARSYDEASSSPLGYFLRNAQQSQLSHPLPVLRAREIDTWARSHEFKDLVRKNQPQRLVAAPVARPQTVAAY